MVTPLLAAALGGGALFATNRIARNSQRRYNEAAEVARLEEREDTAIQRQVLDAQRAGVSPQMFSHRPSPVQRHDRQEQDLLPLLLFLALRSGRRF